MTSYIPLALLLLGVVPLFADLRQAPEQAYPTVPPPVAPLPSRAADWRAARQGLLDRVTKLLGPFPRRVPLEVDEELREEFPDHTRLLLRYRVDAETWTESYLLLPKGFRGRRPGVVVLHQTSDTHMRDSVGLAGRESMHVALHLVRRGYVCIASRNFLWENPGETYQQAADRILNHWHTGMARMTWDAIRATDVLAARPEVDANLLGSIGHSLGGKEVLYHAALDPRIRAAVSCEGGIGVGFSNWDADWYLGPQIHAPGFSLDHQALLALIAPRAFLLIGGESADGARSWPYVESVLPIWRLLRAEERLGLLLHRYGHDLPPPGPDRERVYGWLGHWLAAARSQ